MLAIAVSGRSQKPRDLLGGPDSREAVNGPGRYLLGDWNRNRSKLADRGVTLDLQYVADFLGNVHSQQSSRFAGWDRVRGTVDVDLDSLWGARGLYFHATGLWQGGSNLGLYLGTLTSPSGMSSEDCVRLDSWWLEARWFDQRLVARGGQFAGQDFYGAQHYAASFIFEPMGYALGNLFSTIEVFDPPSTAAGEVRVVPTNYLYLKTMLMDGDPKPFTHNKSGFIPAFRGNGVSVYEIGLTPGTDASSVRAFDNIETRKGYSGLYRFGGSYNPTTFTGATQATTRSENHLFYVMANQAIWRVDPDSSRGLDGTVSYDWSPPSVNRLYSQLTAGLRYNEPLPVKFHNTMSAGYVQSSLSADFLPRNLSAWRHERAWELNVLMTPIPSILVQPVIQYFVNVGGGTQRATVLGFRTKLNF
jgi:carbohydrate-selective porin OprB